MELHSFGEAPLLANALAARIKDILCEAIALRGRAYLVLSGGKTPVDLFKLLAKADIPWDKVTITLADERCVPVDDLERNERLLRDLLLQHAAAKAHFISLYDEKNHGKEQIDRIAVAIDALPVFDAVVLGMGEDGHTASLFPCSEELALALDNSAAAVLRITPKSAPYQRVSLSKQRLMNSRVIFFHVVGAKKLEVLHQAMMQHDPMIMPVSAFLNNYQANIQVMYAP